MSNHIADASKMVDTPRTDAKRSGENHFMGDWVDANFARQLERELNAANQIAKKYEDRYFAALDRIKRLEEAYEGEIGEQPELLGSNVMGLLKRELNFAQKRIKRLEEAGDAMERYCDAISAENWLKAKEAKL